MSDTPSHHVIKSWLSKGDGTCDCRIQAHRQSLIRMLRALWNRQTAEEQQSHSTHKLNGIGFNAFDAKKAGWMLGIIRNGDFDVKVAWKAKFMLKKYAKQLANIKDRHESRNR